MLIALFLAQAADPAVTRRVDSVLARAPIVDGHNDLPWELRDTGVTPESPSLATDTAALPHPLQTDLPRLKRGGVGGQFWSVWIPADVTGPRAVEMTLEQIDRVHRLVARASRPDGDGAHRRGRPPDRADGPRRLADRGRGRASDRRAAVGAAPV
ncbi:membrane dipeptidase [Sphingomonas sp. SORGH_AS_0870]|uniref:membrane dipeptidase n=1 Tax=Sphingomonas sp. SORGH_AS_0870 TaxID=3041801 RepID=UPI00286C465C|nr:membrane dipeptidase [Sphingomonas sp. SORGH_AS_0870]